MTRTQIFLSFALLVAASATPAAAGQISSLYTKLELEKCALVSASEEGAGSAIWDCKGHEGMRIRVAEGDLRYFVSFGPRAEQQRAAGQTLSPFNTIHHTLEWRVERKQGRWVPFATILRYFWDSDGRKGQVLVVTRLDNGDACHVAHIVADGNPKANDMARRAADERARTFDCASQPLKIGRNGALLPN